jgi:hypothetical protein
MNIFEECIASIFRIKALVKEKNKQQQAGGKD